MIEVKIGLHRSSTGANTLNVRPEFAEIPYKSRDCVGRGKRIRTSGPCLPKTVLTAQTTGNQPFSKSLALEQCGIKPRSSQDFTGLTPGAHRGLICAISAQGGLVHG